MALEARLEVTGILEEAMARTKRNREDERRQSAQRTVRMRTASPHVVTGEGSDVSESPTPSTHGAASAGDGHGGAELPVVNPGLVDLAEEAAAGVVVGDAGAGAALALDAAAEGGAVDVEEGVEVPVAISSLLGGVSVLPSPDADAETDDEVAGAAGLEDDDDVPPGSPTADLPDDLVLQTDQTTLAAVEVVESSTHNLQREAREVEARVRALASELRGYAARMTTITNLLAEPGLHRNARDQPVDDTRLPERVTALEVQMAAVRQAMRIQSAAVAVPTAGQDAEDAADAEEAGEDTEG